jgi:hypothetical protein
MVVSLFIFWPGSDRERLPGCPDCPRILARSSYRYRLAVMGVSGRYVSGIQKFLEFPELPAGNGE